VEHVGRGCTSVTSSVNVSRLNDTLQNLKKMSLIRITGNTRFNVRTQWVWSLGPLYIHTGIGVGVFIMWCGCGPTDEAPSAHREPDIGHVFLSFPGILLSRGGARPFPFHQLLLCQCEGPRRLLVPPALRVRQHPHQTPQL